MWLKEILNTLKHYYTQKKNEWGERDGMNKMNEIKILSQDNNRKFISEDARATDQIRLSEKSAAKLEIEQKNEPIPEEKYLQ